MAMRNKHKEKRMAQENPGENPGATEGLRLRSADHKGRTGRLRGWSDSEEGAEGQAELKPKRKKRRAVTTAVEHDLEEGGHFHVGATHLGQPGTYEEPSKVRRKHANEQPKEKKKKKKATLDLESQAEVRKVKGAKVEKQEKAKDKKEKKKRKKDHSEYPEAYGMIGHAMMAPMMGMMRPMSYPMMPGMMMMPGGIIGAPLMGGVGPMGMPGAPTMPYPLPGLPIVRPLPKASSKAEEKRRRFTEAPAPAPPAEPEPEAEADAEAAPVEEPEKRSASASSSSSSSSTSEAKNEGPPSVPVEAPALLPAQGGQTLGEGELELGLISPEPEKEEHSPLQVPPGMESPVASQSPDAEASRLNKPSSWVEVEGETMEELQRELEVTCQNKPCASIATQTEMEEPTAEELSEDLADRWFLGFVDAVPMQGGNKESSDSSDSSDEAEEDATCRPERQLRRRSRSQSQGPAAKSNAEAAEAASSSSSSSSSSGGSRKRQRAPSSDEEASKPTESLAPQMLPVDPRRLRMVQDYSDVA